MPDPEPRDRGVIRHPVRADHPGRDILPATPLDHPRRPFPARVAVEQKRDHHRRIVRGPPMPIRPISAIELRQIHRLHRVQHEPHDVILTKPIPQARRQQQLLLTITRQKVLSHAPEVLTPPRTQQSPLTRALCNSPKCGAFLESRRGDSNSRPLHYECRAGVAAVCWLSGFFLLLSGFHQLCCVLICGCFRPSRCPNVAHNGVPHAGPLQSE